MSDATPSRDDLAVDRAELRAARDRRATAAEDAAVREGAPIQTPTPAVRQALKLIEADLLDVMTLFDQHYDDILVYLMRRQLDRATAEDLAQMTFLEAYDHRATYIQFADEARVWLFGIANNLMRRHLRSEKLRLLAYSRAVSREVEPPDASDEVERRVDARATSGVLAAALASLSRSDYEVLSLHSWAGLSHREIAVALGVPEGTVKSRLNRARHQLRKQLGAHRLGPRGLSEGADRDEDPRLASSLSAMLAATADEEPR